MAPEKNIRALIFDLDGVLVFTDRYHYLAWKKMADSIGVYFDEKINERLRGVSRMASLEIILENYQGRPLTEADKLHLAEEKNAYYRELLGQLNEDSVTMEVRQTLEQLRLMGYQLAVGSSSKNAKVILEQTRLTDAFDAVSDGTNISHSKPDPEVFLKAAEFLGVAPEECAVVEDAEAGIDAAVAGGMLPVGIGSAKVYAKTVCPIRAFPDLLRVFTGSCILSQ